MPDGVLIAVVEEPIVELRPPLVPAQISHAARDLEPGEGPRDVGVRRVPVWEGIAHQEVRLRNDLVPEEPGGRLPGHRLGEVLEEALHDVVVLAPEERHEGQHQQGVEGWRRSLGGEHLLVARAYPGLLSEWGLEVKVEAVDDTPRSPPEAWIGFVPCLGEGGCGGLAQRGAADASHGWIGAPLGRRQLEQERRILILGQQPKQDPACAHERGGLLLPPVFEKSSRGSDGAYALESMGACGWDFEHGPAPGAVELLGEGERERRDVGVRKGSNPADFLRRQASYVNCGAILYRCTRVIEQPAQWKVDSSSNGEQRWRQRRLRRGWSGGWFWQARRDRIGHGAALVNQVVVRQRSGTRAVRIALFRPRARRERGPRDPLTRSEEPCRALLTSVRVRRLPSQRASGD